MYKNKFKSIFSGLLFNLPAQVKTKQVKEKIRNYDFLLQSGEDLIKIP